MMANWRVRWRIELLTPIVLTVLIVACAGCAPSDPLEEIRALQAEGKHAKTLEPLRAMLDEDPSSVEANFLFGRALLLGGEAGLAVWPLRKAAQSPDYGVKAGLLLTRATLRSRFKLEAIRAANGVLAIEPDNVLALELRAEAHMGAADPEAALIDIERVIELDPSNTAVQAHKVLTLISLERIEDATAALVIARETVESAGDEVLETTRAKLCIVSGLFAFERGEREQAELEYAACLEAYPTDLLVVMESISLYDKLGQPEKATGILQSALEQAPTSDFRRAMAERMQAMGNAEESERLLKENAEQLNSMAAWFELADYYAQRDDIDLALEAFERAIEATPNPPQMVRFAYADTLIVANKPDEARRIAGSLEDESLKNLIEGRARLSEGNPQGALAAFEKGIKLWPDNPGARFLAGQAAEQVGDFDRAESNYREAMRAEEKLPRHTEAALYLARLLEAKASYVHALDRIGSYVRSHPDDPEGYIITIRLSDKLARREIFKEGLQRLSRLPGQTGVAVALRSELLLAKKGSKQVVDGIEKSKIDLAAEANAPALKLLVEKLAELERHDEALERVAAALAKHPDSSVFHAVHGSVLQAASAPPSQVRDAYTKAIELAPENADALMSLAEFEATSGDASTALTLYERADATDPATAGAASAALGLARGSLSKPELEQRLVELLRRYPHDASFASKLAVLLAANGGEMQRALELARRAGIFGRHPYEEARTALRAIEASGVQPQADVARAAIERLAEAPSSAPKTNTKTTPGTKTNTKTTPGE